MPPQPRCFLLASLIALAAPSVAEAGLHYRLEVTVSEDLKTLEGQVHVAYVHSGVPADRLPIIFYPERFRAQHPELTDRNFKRYYPLRHNPGGMDVLGVRSFNRASVGFQAITKVDPNSEVGGPDPWVPNYVQVLTFPRPIRAGERVEFSIDFRVLVPERYGLFGRYDDRLTLEGAFHPFIPELTEDGRFDLRAPPMRAQFDAVIKRAGGGELIVAGRRFRDRGRFAGGARTFGLSIGDPLILDKEPQLEDQPRVRVFGRDAERAEAIANCVQRAAQFAGRGFLKELELPGEVILVEAPLRDRLIHARGRVIYYSDHFLHIVFLLEPFHFRELARGVIESLLLRSSLCEAELSDDWWLAAGISTALGGKIPVEEYASVNARNVRGFLDFFSFIPTVDQILRAPRFANSDLFFGRYVDPRDYVRDDLERYANPRVRGRLVLYKVLQRVGEDKIDELVAEITAPPPTKRVPGRLRPLPKRAHRFRAVVSRIAARDPKAKPVPPAFYTLWLGPIPYQNLSIVEVIEDDEGQTITVRVKRSDADPRIGAVGDPVRIDIRSGGMTEIATWDGEGDEGEVVVPMNGGFVKVDLDPYSTNPELFEGDNVYPNSFKILLNRFNLRPDLNGNDNHSAAIGVTVLPFRRYDHPITIDAFIDRQSSGITLGYSRGFGSQIDSRTYGFGLGGNVTFQRLNFSVASNDALIGLRQDGSIGFREFVEAQQDDNNRATLVSTTLSGSFNSQRDPRSPSNGMRLRASVEASSQWLGSDFDFLRYNFSAGFVESIVRGHALAFQIQSGLISGGDIPLQRFPDVGGEGGVRAIVAGDFLGEASLIFKTEYRHVLVEDFEFGVFSLTYMRRLEGAVFFDIGDVGRDYSDIVNNSSGLKHGVGYGLRLHLAAFGVRDTVARVDVAYRTDRQEGRRPTFYFGVNQSF